MVTTGKQLEQIRCPIDIRAGNRDNPTMYPFSMPSSLGGAQEMADVAAYITTLPMSPANGKGPGHNLFVFWQSLSTPRYY